MTRQELELIKSKAHNAWVFLHDCHPRGDFVLSDAIGSAMVKIADVERLCDIRLRNLKIIEDASHE